MKEHNNIHKQKCEELRKIRIKMADKLGIPEKIRREPCNFEGDCSGTCPACYMEERALMDRIYELSKDKSINTIFEDMNSKTKNNNNEVISDIEEHYLMGEEENVRIDNRLFNDTPPKNITSEDDLSDDIRLYGMITPHDNDKIFKDIERQKNNIKIPDFIKGNKK